MTELIRIASDNFVRVITMNRPDKRNALNSEMCETLHDAWRDFESSDDRVALLRAEGPVFTAGLDTNDPPDCFWRAIPNVAFDIGKPVIAAVNGPVIAAGVSMLAFCDLCVATSAASFVYPEGRLGMAAGLISSLVGRIPHKIAMELILTGRPVSAQRAYEVGFVNELCEPGNETDAALVTARQIASAAPMVLRFLKQSARHSIPVGLVEAGYRTQYQAQMLAKSDDAREGELAAKERRTPVFVGR
ncbi:MULTISPECIES: enoyl-CoA hydratase/isomerase family protein [Cupriavidus]